MATCGSVTRPIGRGRRGGRAFRGACDVVSRGDAARRGFQGDRAKLAHLEMAGRSWVPGAGPPSHRMESGYCKKTPFTDSAYMREVQCRIDSDYKSRLRLKERERMQAEQKREQRATQPLVRPTGYTGRSYERPWLNGMPSNRKMDIANTESKEVQYSPVYPRAPMTGRGSKLPSLYNIMGNRQKAPEMADVPDVKGCVPSGPDHGASFQAQRLQLKGKKGPDPHQLLKVPRQSSAGNAPGPPVRRTQSGSLCCGDSAEEEGSARRNGGNFQDPEPQTAGPGPVPCRPLTGQREGTGREAEDEGHRDPGELADPSRLCRQQTSRILRRLRRERLTNTAAERPAAQRGDGDDGDDNDKPPVPPLPLPGTEQGAAAQPASLFSPLASLDDRLPFGLWVRPWAAQEKDSSAAAATTWEEGSHQGSTLCGAEEDRRAGPQPLWPEPGTNSRSTQTFRRSDEQGCPLESPAPGASPHHLGPESPPLLPRLEAGRLVSLLVTTASNPVAAPQPAVSLARLQPISAARLGAASPSWGSGQMRGPLSMTILAVSGLRAQEARERTLASTDETGKEAQDNEKPRPDPETLRKLQESLLREDSEEEEGDLCRICLIPGGTPLNPLLEPCKCVGSLQFVHHDCLKKWLQAKIVSGADLAAVTTCELCKQTLKLDFDNFDVHEFHRKCAASQVEEQMTNSSLYMAVLLHLYEQRFTELMRLLSGSSTSYQFTTADSQPGADGSDIQNSDSDEEDSADLQPHGAIVHDSMLLTFQQRDT
ncbi:E3 ubiquitin-protein ligase MARCHF7-like [Heterodontus francisci]|uniref:E3 ubiquitin-protein ligase MARCHF7-like n=1 Tax=Heterodontus francisci TaxID=7792 RepID=UPI00355C84BB